MENTVTSNSTFKRFRDNERKEMDLNNEKQRS